METCTGVLLCGEIAVCSQDRLGSKTWGIVDPCTEEAFCTVTEASEQDVDAAVKAAHAAFPGWSIDTSAATRAEYLFKLASLLERDKEAIAQLETKNVGKPISQCRSTDLADSISFLRYYAGWADKINGGSFIPLQSKDFVCHTRKEPVGVVAAIVAWNFPLLLAVQKAAPALAVGCTVVIKSSEKTPLSLLAFCKLVEEAGLPRGVFNVVNGFGPSVGRALATHPLVDKVTFTGSAAVGRALASECAAAVKRVTLELGGKSPLIVLSDADLDKAAETAWKGLFHNSGQCCVACSRVLVQSQVYEKFVSRLAEFSSAFASSCHPTDPKCNLGPIIDKLQYEKVKAYIASGIAEGARLVAGGKPKEGRGLWIEPTIFADVRDDMKIAREEIFGPVICVFKFDSMEEAVRRANATEYGLGAGVFTTSISKSEYFVRRLRAGLVWVNSYLYGDVTTPFGGFKQSGYGREGGEEGLAPFLELKTVFTHVQVEEKQM